MTLPVEAAAGVSGLPVQQWISAPMTGMARLPVDNVCNLTNAENLSLNQTCSSKKSHQRASGTTNPVLPAGSTFEDV